MSKQFVVYYSAGNRLLGALCHDKTRQLALKKLNDYIRAGWKIDRYEIRHEIIEEGHRWYD